MTIDVNGLLELLDSVYKQYAETEAICLEIYRWTSNRIKTTIRQSLICLWRDTRRMQMRVALDALVNKMFECVSVTERVCNKQIRGYDPNNLITQYITINKPDMITSTDIVIYDEYNTCTVYTGTYKRYSIGDLRILSDNERRMIYCAYTKVATNLDNLLRDVDDVSIYTMNSSKSIKQKIKLKVTKIRQIAITLAALARAAANVFTNA
jgi:hypothetical protein